MTEFGGLEREMLKIMVQLFEDKNLSVYNWLSKLFDDKISFEGVLSGISYECRIEIRHNGFEKSDILSKINELYFLFVRLGNDLLIGVNEFENVTHVEINEGKTYTISSEVYEEKKMYRFLIDYGTHPILVSNYLIELVKNDFRTPEQIRFEKQLDDANEKHSQVIGKAQIQVKYSRLAFVVSLVTLVISSVLGIWTKCSETKIDQSQLSQIKQSIEQTTLPDVIKTEITNDTLTTRIVEKPKAQ
jgi:hypothetical protein